MIPPTVLCNGVAVSAADPADRGLHYGDGVFRTLRILGGLPVAWRAHQQRLGADCAHLGLPAPDDQTLAQEARVLFADGGNGVLKVLVTRGAGGRGYAPPADARPNRWLFRYPPPTWPRAYAGQGVAIGLSSTAMAVSPALAGVKHCNRLEQVLARRECSHHGWPEALMQTADGRVICGTMSNLFVVRDGCLNTPAIVDAGVLGATRQRLLAACARRGRACAQGRLTVDDIRSADEIFLCNSLMEVWPVREFAGQRFAVGEATRWCQRQLRETACAGW